ncbi:ICE-like protease (caspase) p20 domain protein [Rhizoctonia solani]|uniref:ICE-like protease (Caspase) p20 domain protein n=1 Tax=Rhizoctonia solani TaxID=456999 RepID=A0A8H8NUT5_9AGAM|nr:ICE-like protease (caspase) p20 domain protein [Rhizoctonia solani]QRW19930.1 ICE-like protease (caspase) p20 domain protein [Rhizoctonia solani]
MRKINRRATVSTEVGIDDNWVELNVPELALPTSAPAIEASANGRASAHLGRFGAALSNVVPLRIPQVGSLHAQTARHTTRTSSTSNGSNNRRVWHGERKESTKTLSAASNIVTAFILTPNPGPQRQTRSNWFNILPEEPSEPVEEPDEYAGGSEGSFLSDGDRTAIDSEMSLSFGCVSSGTLDTEITSTSPTYRRPGALSPIQIPSSASCGSQRASSLPLPNECIQSYIPEPSQVIMIESRNPLFESPAPFTFTSTSTPTTTSFGIQQQQPSTSMTSARSILEGLTRLFEAVDRQSSIGSIPSHPNARNYPYFSDFPTPVDDREWDICNLTPATAVSSWYTADSRERKLLIIGSGYDSENFRRATAETNATLATLSPLRGVSHDVKSLTSVFNKRSFIVEKLVGDSFNAQDVLDKVKEFLSDAIEGDVRAIVFTGHATCTQADGKVAIVPPSGCHRTSNPDEGLISADAWREAVNQSTQPGVIVLSIFASCLSGGIMDQPINIRDLNGPVTTEAALPSSQLSSPAPIFITFASSQFNQNTYESIVGPPKDLKDLKDSKEWIDQYRYGDHFLRAFTLAARDPRAVDWERFIRVLEDKLSKLRNIGAYCAENDPDVRNFNWLEDHPQVPVYGSSKINIPALEDVLPWEISLFKRESPTPGLSRSINVAEEFLAHVSLCGETPEITHYTLPTPSNVVPPVIL